MFWVLWVVWLVGGVVVCLFIVLDVGCFGWCDFVVVF